MSAARHARRGLGLAAWFGVLAVAPGAFGAEKLGIEDVSKLVVTTGPELAAAREHAQAAAEQSNAARGKLLPSVRVSDEYQHWDSPFAFSGFGTVRDLNTNTFTAGASQPLVGLLSRHQDYRAKKASAGAAQQGVRAAESDVRESVELEFLRYFEAKTRGDVARASAQELDVQVKETEARVKAGTLTKADLLRVSVAASTARQQGIVADADATVSRATLLVAIGRSPEDTSVEFVAPTALLAQGDMPAPDPASVEAKRAEIQQAKLKAEAADHDASARKYGLLPEINLEGAYVRTDGSIFNKPNAAFIGVKADWAIWEWGSKLAAKDAAAAEARAAALDVDSTRRKVKAEVTGRKAQLSAAVSAVALAQETIVSAEEAYRVTTALVRAGSGTTTDLLAAESALTQARLALEQARYAQAASRIRLERAAGNR